MDVFKVLDLALGIVFIFLLVATLCSAIREGIEACLKTRAAYLERGIRELLGDAAGATQATAANPNGLTTAVFNHPLLNGLFLGTYVAKPPDKALSIFACGRGLPSYIPAKIFALALLDIAMRGPETNEVSADPGSPPMTVLSIRERLLNVSNQGVRRVLLTALDTSRGDLELVRKSVEDWFNSSMDRVSGWYKRSSQWIMLMIAIVVTVGVNVDTLALADFLYHDPAARGALVVNAEEISKKAPDAVAAAAALDKLELPIGWKVGQLPEGTLQWVNHGLGWLITVLAAMLGAPFWFDLLNRIVAIRSTLKPLENNAEAAPNSGSPPRAPAGLATLPAAQPAAVFVVSDQAQALRSRDREVDGCGISGIETSDEELPAAAGGVG